MRRLQRLFELSFAALRRLAQHFFRCRIDHVEGLRSALLLTVDRQCVLGHRRLLVMPSGARAKLRERGLTSTTRTTLRSIAVEWTL
jgi:hypothetical protein